MAGFEIGRCPHVVVIEERHEDVVWRLHFPQKKVEGSVPTATGPLRATIEEIRNSA
jgi:hypothetical protein